MCLAVPMRILRLLEGGRAVVAQGPVEVEVDVSLLENPRPGDHVIVHAGYAIEILALQEAEERLALFRRMAELGGEQ
jgi:hydrogenase expression/formation protein HypC